MGDYPISYGYDRRLLLNEATAREEEGADPERVHAIRRAIEAEPEIPPRARFQELYGQLAAVPERAGWPYREPSDLDTIRAERPSGPRYRGNASDDELDDRILAAWLGRACGCLLGKPVEGWSRERIIQYLQAVGAYPLEDYLPLPASLGDCPFWPESAHGWFRGRIDGMPRDDDMDYPVLNLMAVERYGPEVSSRDIAHLWLQHLPYEGVYTAERMAYRSLIDQVDPPESARRFNPYREWIGAQIRADLWGYISPGDPGRAASLAWQDASVSHTGNGIYGEMFAAALLASALTAGDVDEALDAALEEVPARSRFAEMVSQVRSWARQNPDPDACRDRIEERFGMYHWVHTLNNAAIVVMALACSGGDYGRGIGLAVTGGWDTDCNGATVGSVLGALGGTGGIPARWSEPLHDRLSTFVIGETENRISVLAARTRAVTRRQLHRLA